MSIDSCSLRRCYLLSPEGQLEVDKGKEISRAPPPQRRDTPQDHLPLRQICCAGTTVAASLTMEQPGEQWICSLHQEHVA